MRKSIAIPPLNNQSHRRNAVVERVCRIEATPLPAAVVDHSPTTMFFPHFVGDACTIAA
jgi:hypothetical protein